MRPALRRLRWSAALWGTLLLPGAARTQEPEPVPVPELRFRHELYRDARVTAYRVEIPPGQATRLHRHAKDLLAIFLEEGRTLLAVAGQGTVADVLSPGDVRFHEAGFTHSNRNREPRPLRTVVLEFAEPQGEPLPDAEAEPVHTCTPGTAVACVDEQRVLCTRGVCVDDVRLGPGAVRQRAAGEEQLLVAVSDTALAVEQTPGARPRTLSLAPGELAQASGTRWTNTGSEPVHLVLVTLR